MLGYIIDNKYPITINNYKIKSFDVLHKTDLNIFVIENNKVLYVNNLVNYASRNCNIKFLKFYSNNINIKKLIKSIKHIFIKTVKFKTHNKYLKGYQKN